MGADYLQQLDFDFVQLGTPRTPSSAQDTIDAAAAFVDYGGDGTARDVLSAASSATSFLGVPAGVKMHSGVFAISPRAAARVVADLANGRLIDRVPREVRDYIEPESGAAAARDAVIRTRGYGELWVPEVNDLLQQTKVGGKETEALAINEISSYVTECWLDDRQTAVILGPGSTCMEIKRGLGIPATLLGVDVRLPDHSHITDATANQLLAVTQELSAHVVLSFTRQQAFLLGRGNQQLTPAVLANLRWPSDYTVVSSRQKLLALQQRPLLVDSDDPALDAKICGLVDVVTGYDERSLYRVATPI
jgi:predicted polyphosphate/ATP-dependent NAD kinase